MILSTTTKLWVVVISLFQYNSCIFTNSNIITLYFLSEYESNNRAGTELMISWGRSGKRIQVTTSGGRGIIMKVKHFFSLTLISLMKMIVELS